MLRVLFKYCRVKQSLWEVEHTSHVNSLSTGVCFVQIKFLVSKPTLPNVKQTVPILITFTTHDCLLVTYLCESVACAHAAINLNYKKSLMLHGIIKYLINFDKTFAWIRVLWSEFVKQTNEQNTQRTKAILIKKREVAVDKCHTTIVLATTVSPSLQKT